MIKTVHAEQRACDIEMTRAGKKHEMDCKEDGTLIDLQNEVPSTELPAGAADAIGARQIVAVTVTATPPTRAEIIDTLFRSPPQVFAGSFERPNLANRVERRQVLAGRSNPDLSRDVRTQGERTFELLARGLGRYAITGS